MAKKEFQAESKKLMDMMINSIYTNKEIFLRELISNASDAIDKLYYKSLTDPAVGMNKEDFHILITRDKENRILTVEDNGIGMTKAELEENLGTIAHSGSLDFKKDNKDENIDIIGQFGVGFYSSFMVADKVTVISKAYGSDEAWQWESSGVDGYEMTPAQKDTAGTQIILHIKPDTDTDHYDNFLDEYGIDPKGKQCVVVGRSNIVGKPMAILLLQRHGTVTICHSRTPNLAEICRTADILVAAVGKVNIVTADMIKPGAVVIDVAMNHNDAGKLCGDVDYEAAKEVASAITPVPGGVGPMTRAMLMKNTLLSARKRQG